MQAIPVFLLIAVGIVVTVLLVRYFKKLTNQAWAAAAATLELEFVDDLFKGSRLSSNTNHKFENIDLKGGICVNSIFDGA